MDSATLRQMREQVGALISDGITLLDTIDQALAAADRVCARCHRSSRHYVLGGDGQWRSPHCHRRYEAAAGVQLPIEGEPRG